MQGERLLAIVLRRTDYGEADRILQLLTPAGRRSVIAKGVRREKSKLAGGIELFALCDVVIRPGRGELGMLTSARMKAFYGQILAEYERMEFAYTVLKMVSSASDQIDEAAWFSVVRQVFEQLNQASVEQKLVETWFYVNYAELLGDELNLRSDVRGQKLVAEKSYMYDAAERALRPSEQGDLTSEHIKLLRLIAAKPLEVVAQIGGIESVIDGCWLLARSHAGV